MLKTSIRFIDISTCFRIRPKFYVDTILTDKLYKTNVRGVGHCGYWDTWYIFNVQRDAKNVRNVQNLIFWGGNAMIDTIYSIYLTQ